MNTTNETTLTDAAFAVMLARFVAELQLMINEHFAKGYPNLTPSRIEIDPKGRKFVRLWSVDGGHNGRSAFCFVERSTGNVFKPATWKAPAKHSRGNISEHASESCTVYGAKYLK